MQPLRRRRSSVYDYHRSESKPSVLDTKFNLFGRKLPLGITIGILLSIIPIILQGVAYSTAHWKEISPNTNSLYIDRVDALIRTEILVYFNAVHRSTRHSYGLFHRCEYSRINSSNLIQNQDQSFTFSSNRIIKICTKNYLPLYDDERFNDCHSLQYYRYCYQSNERNFNIDNNYLRATFDIHLKSNQIIDSTSICACSYPKYIQFCQVFGAISLIFLCSTMIFFAIFPLMKTRNQYVTVKCFGVLSSIFAIIFILINLLVVLNYFDFELTEYFNSIQRHYYSNQIYRLSEDLRHAIERLLSSIHIRNGYSMKLSWLAFIVSIIDGILLMITCKINNEYNDINQLFKGISRNSSEPNPQDSNQEYRTLVTPFPIQNDHPETSQPSIIPSIVITDCDQQSQSDTLSIRSCLKRSSLPRIHFFDQEKS